MPIYEYYCSDCQTKFDARRPMSKADTAIQCKNCEGMRTSRLLSMFAVGGNAPDKTPGWGNYSGGGGCCGGGGCGCH